MGKLFISLDMLDKLEAGTYGVHEDTRSTPRIGKQLAQVTVYRVEEASPLFEIEIPDWNYEWSNLLLINKTGE